MRTAHENPPTKARLLDAAERLMLAKGFTATSVEDICQAAKVTKGSFFHYFESKDQLGREVLERFCAAGEKMHQAFCGIDADPLKRVYQYIDNTIKMAKDPPRSQGCLLGLFSQELCDTNPTMRAACNKGFADWAKGLKKEMVKAKAKYAPRASFDPGELAEYLIAVLEGSLIIGKARSDMSVVASNLRHVRDHLTSLFRGKRSR